MGGQLIVELLVAFGLASVLIPVIILGFISGSNGKVQQEQRLYATGLLKEAEEATRSFREAEWSNIATNGTYHPTLSGNTWTLASGTETLGDFTRKVEIADVSPADPSKKQITITVSWSNILPTNMTSTFILTRWKNISSTLTAGGTLLNQGNGDWCAPTLGLTTLDLPKNGVANAISAFQFGSNVQIAAGTGDNASGVSYANVQVTDPAVPATPSASIAGTFDGFKTNDVFTEQSYAYLGTDNNAKEVEIINLTTLVAGKYLEAGYFNAPGSANAQAVATSGNVGYAAVPSAGPNPHRLYDFDLSSKTGSRSAIDADGITLDGTPGKMMLYGQRAYVTTSALTAQLEIIDISNTSNLVVKKKVQLAGQAGRAVYVNPTGTRAYVATAQSSSQREVFVVNIDETSAGFGTVLGSYDTNGMDPKGIVLVNITNYVIVVGTGGSYQYQVIDVSDEAHPILCTRGGTVSGQLAIPTGVNGIATVFTAAQRAFSYIITGDATTELKVIEGGPGAGGSGGGGGLIVESPTLDAGHSAIFNRIGDITVTPSSGVTATYQVAVSTDCSTYNYTGNYTTAGGQIPLNINPGRCFRYKVTFSGTPGPVSTTVSVNYSP
jgi:hypothetical protein